MAYVFQIALTCWFAAVGLLAIRKRQALNLFLVSGVCIVGLVGVNAALSLAAQHTAKYDLWLYSADTALGSPAFLLGRIFSRTWLYTLLQLTYDLMPLVMLLVYAAHLLLRGTPQRVLAAFAVNFAAGYLIYLLLPACGPRYAFPDFPALPPTAPALYTLRLLAPPNCMPSLHVSTAVLVCWFCRRWFWAQPPVAVNLALTVMATLVGGEHYAVDLVAAVPFALFVYAAAQRKFRAAAVGLGVTLAFCCALRFGLAYILAAPRVFAALCASVVAAGWLYWVKLFGNHHIDMRQKVPMSFAFDQGAESRHAGGVALLERVDGTIESVDPLGAVGDDGNVEGIRI